MAYVLVPALSRTADTEKNVMKTAKNELKLASALFDLLVTS
jgi:hypothetical protein